MVDEGAKALRGRQAEAARNDTAILDAARAVFIDDPSAPIAAVAAAAGVGVGALYRRYPSKDVLLQTLCRRGLERFLQIAENALRDHDDPWESFAAYLTGIIESDVHSLTVRLAGTFPTTDALRALAVTAGAAGTKVFRRARSAGVLRPDLVANDVSMLFEQMAAIRLGDARRTAALRRRYVVLLLDGLRAGAPTPLPGGAPTSDELSARWRPRSEGS